MTSECRHLSPRIDDVLEMYQTDSDLALNRLVGRGLNRDLLETQMLRFFTDSACQDDFLIYNRRTKDIVSICLSDRSTILRNECLG